jgi:hypothetical protein
MYDDNEPLTEITRATGLTQTQIGKAVTAAGRPFIVLRESASPSAEPELVTAAALIAWGMQHPNSRMNRLADQARTALADLQQAQRRSTAVSAAEERLREAREQVAAAEEALRAAKGTKAPAPTPVAGTRPDKAEAALIREWAREHGHPVGTVGVISRDLVDAYRAATTPDGATP